ncbi:MAG: iron transporter [Elusimicrobia bacterium]|nr:iron transporter [Elusimicrobiota bacterium]
MKKSVSVLLLLGAFASGSAFAYEERIKEYPIGTAKEINRMRVAAVYLLPIDMEPRGMDLPQSQADVHLEADIHASRGNLNGFGAGEWIPFLKVSYTLVNVDTGETKSGTFMPMVAKDGPHYGSNVKMMGAGNYTLTFVIDPPSKQGFGRHTDVATGVGKWFQQFAVNYSFKWVPIK